MSQITTDIQNKAPQAKPTNSWKTAFIVLVILVVLAPISYVIYKEIFPSEFTPVTLSQKEQQQLDQKIQNFENFATRTKAAGHNPSLQPEKYSEAGASREINFTEKELNALLANNTNLATRLAIDLSDNLASAKLLIPVDPDAPILGGQTIKVTAGLELAYAENKPIVVLKGVSLWGVPIPNAWLGNMKNVDLVKEFGNDQGFWKSFADGVEHVQVREGALSVKLKE